MADLLDTPDDDGPQNSDDPAVAALVARRGAPQKYEPRYAKQAAKLYRLGATDHEVAEFFGVWRSTIFNWRADHPEFAAAMRAGKDEADERVVRSLYHRAVGYDFHAEKIFSANGRLVRAPYVEHVPPDVGAAKSWLTNRRPAEWREKVSVGGDPDGAPIVIVQRLTDASRNALPAPSKDPSADG